MECVRVRGFVLFYFDSLLSLLRGDEDVSTAAEQLLAQLEEPRDEFCGGRGSFRFRGVEVRDLEGLCLMNFLTCNLIILGL